jgi:hypothetical protein
MELTYNDTALHDLGKIIIASQQTQGDPEEAPQRWRTTLRVRIHFHEPSYADNYTLVQQVRAILRQQEAVLQWTDDSGSVRLNQTVKLAGHDWPEDPNEKGTYFQSITLVFTYFENLDGSQTNCITMTMTRVGGGGAVTLGNVDSVKWEQDTTRYTPQRKHRSDSQVRVSVRGKWLGDTSLSVTARRAALLAKFDELQAEITDGSEHTIVFGTINQAMRVAAFTADIDQAQNAVVWSFTAGFTDFLNEANYAQAQFDVVTREDLQEGKVSMTLSGEIAADSESAATAKLTTIRSAVASGYTLARTEYRSSRVDGADGATFIKLSFTEDLDRVTSSLAGWELRMSDQEELQAGMIRRSYSGFVEATSAASFTAAAQTAYDKAATLGDHKHHFKLQGSITLTDKQQSADRTATGDYRARVEFSFEYRLKGTRAYMEIISQVDAGTFNVWAENISGYIVATSADSARGIYNTVKAGYGATVLRGEQVTERRDKVAVDASAVTGNTRTPPLHPTGAVVNTGEVVDSSGEAAISAGTVGITNPPSLGAGYVRQWHRLEFSFQIHRPRPTQKVAVKYQFDVSKDYLQNEKITRLSGTVFAASQAEAESFLTNTFLPGFSLGNAIQIQTAFDRERWPSQSDTFLAMNFTAVYADELTAENAILECQITEEIESSGARIVVQPTAASTDVLQTCGTQSGRRTVSGMCVATNETTALAWVKRQRSYPLPASGFSQSGDREELPPRIAFEPVFVPRIDAVGRAGTYPVDGALTANYKAVRCRFQFTEVFTELRLL